MITDNDMITHEIWILNTCSSLAADKFPRDDEQIQATADIHQKCCHEELLREVHQLHSGLYFYLQTGMDRQYMPEKSIWQFNLLHDAVWVIKNQFVYK